VLTVTAVGCDVLRFNFSSDVTSEYTSSSGGRYSNFVLKFSIS
jgi:hypothetical protein